VTTTVLHLGREALLLALLVSAPPLGAALLVGLVTGTLQAATQLQEHAIGAVPRIAAVIAALLVFAPWIGARLARFAAEVLALAAGGVP
jgi:type III secretory pathway component EscS